MCKRERDETRREEKEGGGEKERGPCGRDDKERMNKRNQGKGDLF